MTTEDREIVRKRWIKFANELGNEIELDVRLHRSALVGGLPMVTVSMSGPSSQTTWELTPREAGHLGEFLMPHIVTPTTVPAASERMTAEWVVPFCLNCGHEIPPRTDLLSHIATLTARAEAAEARAEGARALALKHGFSSIAIERGDTVDFGILCCDECLAQCQVGEEMPHEPNCALSLLTAPPPTAGQR